MGGGGRAPGGIGVGMPGFFGDGNGAIDEVVVGVIIGVECERDAR